MDISSFTTNRMLLELFVAKQFGRLEIGEAGDSRGFVAQALHDAVPISADEYERFMGSSTATNVLKLIDGEYTVSSSSGISETPQMGKYIVKARIIADENEEALEASENPHGNLPDPCSLTDTSDFDDALEKIIQHTTFITSEDFQIVGAATIGKDDLIGVTMTINESGHIDLEAGIVDNIRLKNNADAAARRLTPINCVTLSSLFGLPASAAATTATSVPAALYDTDDKIRWLPTAAGSITSRFGMRMHPIRRELAEHNGTDIGAPTGTNVYAAADGVISHRRTDASSGYGLQIQLQHGNPDGGPTPLKTGVGSVVSRYAHLSEFIAIDGATVSRGDIIGKVGSTGLSTGPHLHFEILVRPSGGSWTYVDPEVYARENPE
tara:strand:+ start:7425 stop:8567 length:1143 start_codon:yes stop_codon:yes gene_type:complete